MIFCNRNYLTAYKSFGISNHIQVHTTMNESATITLPTTLLTAIREKARAEKRSLSKQVELLVESHFATTRVAPGSGAARRRKPSTRRAA